MSIVSFIFILPLLAAIALAFVPRNFAVIMRAVAARKLTVDKLQPRRLFICSAPALDLSTPRGHAERPLAGLFFVPLACRASYVTKLIPKKQLEQKLHEAVRLAPAHLERGEL
ncbi:MAG: hypothetical protein HY298_23220 [Verrucomicrobia bacterium]|nr:hypothetical protein [Verrucomicrobiota bacterium]